MEVIPSQPPGKDVVEKLEDVLERARLGEFSAVCIVTIDREGRTASARSSLPNISTMVGGLLRAANRIMDDSD